MDKKKIIDLLKEKLADILEISVDDVELSPVAIFEHKTIDMFADYIANGGECAESEE